MKKYNRPNVLMVPARPVIEQAMFIARMALGDAPDDGLAHPFGLRAAARPMVWTLGPEMFDRLYLEVLGVAGPYVVRQSEADTPITHDNPATMTLFGFPVEVDERETGIAFGPLGH